MPAKGCMTFLPIEYRGAFDKDWTGGLTGLERGCLRCAPIEEKLGGKDGPLQKDLPVCPKIA
jgi:hypothetical protein